MSNGLTAVFIDVLSLSGSQLAQTIDEKRLIIWFSEKDQSKVGIGTVGFDICEMPWNAKTFDNDKVFLLKVIEQAKRKIGWNALDYEPREDFIISHLDKFEKLISLMTIDKIVPENLYEWLAAAKQDDPVLCDFPKCPSTMFCLLFSAAIFAIINLNFTNCMKCKMVYKMICAIV